MKSHRKLSINSSIHGKNHEISGPYNFWTPLKSNIPDVWNGNCWTLFGLEIEVGLWGCGCTPVYNLSEFLILTFWIISKFNDGVIKFFCSCISFFCNLFIGVGSFICFRDFRNFDYISIFETVFYFEFFIETNLLIKPLGTIFLLKEFPFLPVAFLSIKSVCFYNKPTLKYICVINYISIT